MVKTNFYKWWQRTKLIVMITYVEKENDLNLKINVIRSNANSQNQCDIGRMERCRNEDMEIKKVFLKYCQKRQQIVTSSIYTITFLMNLHILCRFDVCVDGPPERQNLKEEANILQQTIAVEYGYEPYICGRVALVTHFHILLGCLPCDIECHNNDSWKS
ncbi:hypothetical protein Lal_00013474 [Lupinus albus]|nr:hypothetical protein Lal_00013474 [Lupinus albus]